MVPERPDDLVVSGDHPETELLVPVDGVRLAQLCEARVRVGDEIRREEVVEIGRDHVAEPPASPEYDFSSRISEPYASLMARFSRWRSSFK